jgi:hypothetical protein
MYVGVHVLWGCTLVEAATQTEVNTDYRGICMKEEYYVTMAALYAVRNS